MSYYKGSVWYRALARVKNLVIVSHCCWYYFCERELAGGQHEHRGEMGKDRQDQDTAIKPLWLEHWKGKGGHGGERAGMGLRLDPQHHTEEPGQSHEVVEVFWQPVTCSRGVMEPSLMEDSQRGERQVRRCVQGRATCGHLCSGERGGLGSGGCICWPSPQLPR